MATLNALSCDWLVFSRTIALGRDEAGASSSASLEATKRAFRTLEIDNFTILINFYNPTKYTLAFFLP